MWITYKTAIFSAALVGLAVILTGEATALAPPTCTMAPYGTLLSADAMADDRIGEDAVVGVHFPGGEGFIDWEGEYPPMAFELADSDGGELSYTEPNLRLRDRQLHLYEPPHPLDFGTWEIDGMDHSWRVHVLPTPEQSLVMEADVTVDVTDSPFIRETYVTMEDRARHSLRLTVPIPQEWIDWEPALDEDVLLAVRLSVDEPVEMTPLVDGDGFRVADGRPVVSYSSWLYECWAPITVDWYGGDTLHGLIWPVGLDPEDISLHFEVTLAGPHQKVEQVHGDSSVGCTAVSTGSPLGLKTTLLLLLGMVLFRCRVRRD